MLVKTMVPAADIQVGMEVKFSPRWDFVTEVRPPRTRAGLVWRLRELADAIQAGEEPSLWDAELDSWAYEAYHTARDGVVITVRGGVRHVFAPDAPVAVRTIARRAIAK
jgi:hypothetical protein